MAIIQASDLVKSYENPDDSSKYFNAVDGISLSINRGEVYGILGPNGAGKTTTLEMLEGLKDIDGGTAFINSINVQDHPYQVKQIIGVQLQANEYFDKMTLSELLDLFSALYSLVSFCLLLSITVGGFLSDGFNWLFDVLFDNELIIGTWSMALPGVRGALWLASIFMLLASGLAWISLRSPQKKVK